MRRYLPGFPPILLGLGAGILLAHLRNPNVSLPEPSARVIPASPSAVEKLKQVGARKSSEPGQAPSLASPASVPTKRISRQPETVTLRIDEERVRALEKDWDVLRAMAYTAPYKNGWKIHLLWSEGPFAEMGLKEGDQIELSALVAQASDPTKSALIDRLIKVFKQIEQ